MADTVSNVLSVICTTGSRLSELTIKNGQLIFVQDTHKVALDFNDKRVFYNRIVELDTEADRTGLLAPVNGLFYFVISTCCLWRYEDDSWVQLTSPPSGEIIFNGTENPLLGEENKLYINTEVKNISVWDEDSGDYIVVADVTNEISEEEINAMFE